MAENVETPAVETKNETAPDLQKIQAELEAALAREKKLKENFDKTASEVAEYKRKEKERMSDEEKKAAEIEALKNDYKAVTLDLNKTKAESVFAKKGGLKRSTRELSRHWLQMCHLKRCQKSLRR